jgi:hypothetical protein
MSNSLTNNSTVNRNIKYINRDFSDFRSNLIEFAKTYFPNTITDFSAASPGTMFIEMASYVGDVLSFYTDNQIQENFIQYAKQLNNLYDLAYMMGYKPSVTSAASTEVDIFQTVPAVYNSNSDQNVPDFRYALTINENTSISSGNGSSNFLIQNKIDFSESSSLDPTTISVYELSGDQPSSFLLKKTAKAISATINTTTITVGEPERFATYNITTSRPLGILDITDSDGNEWTEVDYLAQETVFETIKNTNPFPNDPNTQSDSAEVGSLLRLKKVPRRFVSRFVSSNNLNSGSATLQLQFGAGSTNDYDEQISPNPANVGIGLPTTQDKLTTAYSPSNFMFTKTYGVAPSNTTLTVRYLTGGGVGANIPANTLNTINTTSNVLFNNSNLDATLAQTTFDSLAINNPNPATGGGDGDSAQDIKTNSLANYASQLRSVTQEDYLVRALSMPSQYGSLAKAYIESQKITNLSLGESPSALDLYILAYDNNKNLITSSNTLKQNLSTYLSQYRIINDSIKIKDAFIINIGINFEIVVLPNYNSNEVLTQCILKLQEYFNVDNMQINSPILIRELYNVLGCSDTLKGVQNVKKIEIVNKVGVSDGYSQYAYDINGATVNNVVYPSQDPSIFEVKFPNTDIKGRVVPL